MRWTLPLSLAIAAPGVCAAADDAITYRMPPKCLIWMEGEACQDHNWSDGPQRNCWAFGWAGVHGGVLDLALWRLPESGSCYARFPFELSDAGEYVLYFLGRVPGLLASPIEWHVDSRPVARVDGGYEVPGRLAVTETWKYAVLRLGTFYADPGEHTLTITVREFVDDMGLDMISQQIDAIGIAPASWPVEPAEPPTAAAVPQPQHEAPDAAGAPPVEVRAGDLQVSFSPVNAGVREMRLGDVPLATASEAQASIRVEFTDGTLAALGDATVEQAGRSAPPTLSLRGAGVVARLTPALDGAAGEMRLSLRVTNQGSRPVQRVRLSLGSGVALGSDAGDDTWIVGQDVLTPDQTVGEHRRISPQFAFDWVCLHDDATALYAMFEDRSLLDTEVEWGRSDAGSAGSLAFSKFPRIAPGATWDCPPLVLGAYHGGDWHRAADRYSRWWYSWAESPHVPAWAQAMGGMTLGGSYHDEDANEANAALVADTQAATGITWYHGSGWISGRTECWYPVQYGLPPNELLRMRQVTDALRQHGARSSVYTNPLMFSRAAPEYDLWGRDLATVAPDGGLWFTEHTHHHHPMALPYANREWALRYCAALERAVLGGRPDMLYMDQLGAVPSHLDFRPEKHGHEHYGEWVAGSTEFARTVREHFGLAHPGLVAAIECPCPAIQQHVSFALLGTTRVLRYAFPTYHGFVGTYRAVEPQVALEHAREALLTGQPLLLVDARMVDATEAERAAVRPIVKLKQAVDPLLYAARYRDTIGISASEGTEARAFVVATGAFAGDVATAARRAFVTFTRTNGEASTITVDRAALGIEGLSSARLWGVSAPDAVHEVEMIDSGEGGLVLTGIREAAGAIELR